MESQPSPKAQSARCRLRRSCGKQRDRAREPLQIRVAEILEPEKVVFTNQTGGSLVDQDLTRSRVARKPRGEIHWRPNRRIFKALGTRDRADRHETAPDA